MLGKPLDSDPEAEECKQLLKDAIKSSVEHEHVGEIGQGTTREYLEKIKFTMEITQKSTFNIIHLLVLDPEISGLKELGEMKRMLMIMDLVKHCPKLLQEEDSWFGQLPLSQAIGWGQVLLAKLLIREMATHGFKKEFNHVSKHRDYQNVAIVLAAERLVIDKGSLEIIKQLVKNGADINAVDRYDHTALHWAALIHDHEAIKFLIEHDANRDIKSKSGKTAKDYFNESTESLKNDMSRVRVQSPGHVKDTYKEELKNPEWRDIEIAFGKEYRDTFIQTHEKKRAEDVAQRYTFDKFLVAQNDQDAADSCAASPPTSPPTSPPPSIPLKF